ncbi:MAG: flagellar hook-basal body complex protein FliE [Mariprofundus sp.]|nr:flagellar hook-basal body complex protein FliE [Mariprofundus sp.]
MNIHGYQSAVSLTPGNGLHQAGKPTTGSGNFATLLNAYVNEVNHDSKAAGKAAVALATGESKNTSETLLAIKKADLSFQMMLSVRNKLVEAYREISRMQV